MSKAKLEGLFADELALLQPTPGSMRLLEESLLQIWKARKATVHEEIATAERATKAIQSSNERAKRVKLVDETGARWNRVLVWWRRLNVFGDVFVDAKFVVRDDRPVNRGPCERRRSC